MKLWCTLVLLTSMSLTAHAQGDTPEEGPPPTGVDGRATFAQEAWKVRREPFMSGLSLPPGFNQRASVVDAQGQEVTVDALAHVVHDEKIRDQLQSPLRLPAVRWAMAGLSIAATIVPVVTAIPGLVVGALLGGVFLYRTHGETTGDVLSRYSPLMLGIASGAAMGVGAGAVAGLLLMVLVGQGMSLALKPLDDKPLVAAVVTHNTALAESLQLDTATLPAEYFPTTP